MSKDVSGHEIDAGTRSGETVRRMFEELLGDFPDGAVVFDADYVIVAANEAYCKLVDYTREELIGLPIQSLAVESKSELDRWVERLLSDGRQAARGVIQTGSGEVRLVDYTARTQVVSGLHLAFVRDVTEEERDRALVIRAGVLDSLEAGVYVIDTSGLITLWNRAAEKITGYTAEQVLGTQIASLGLAPEHEIDVIRPRVLAAMQAPPPEQNQRQAPIEVTGLRRRADGAIYPSRAEISPLRDEQGLPVGVLVMLHDLGRKRTREIGAGGSGPTAAGPSSVLVSVGRDAIGGAPPAELLTSAVDRLAADFDVHYVASWRIDARVGEIQLEAGHGWPEGTLEAAPRESPDAPRMLSESALAFTGEDWAPGSPLLAAGVRSGVIAPIQGHGRSSGGALAVYSRDLRRFSAEEIEAIAAVAELIGAARARVRLGRIEGALDIARRQASVGALISGVVHDFNNMLSVMLGYARLMAPQAQDSELLREGVEEIEAAARRAMRLSRSLVDLGRQPETEPEVLEVGAIVDEVGELLHRTIGDLIALETEITVPAVHVLMPPGELDRAIVNLVANARDAMPDGGRVVVRVARRPPGEGPGAGRGTYGDVVVQVIDHGEGMEPEVLERALEPSFTTKGRGEGSGVGLTSVAAIVRAAGGLIELESDPGEGTTARLILPVTPPAADPRG